MTGMQVPMMKEMICRERMRDNNECNAHNSAALSLQDMNATAFGQLHVPCTNWTFQGVVRLEASKCHARVATPYKISELSITVPKASLISLSTTLTSSVASTPGMSRSPTASLATRTSQLLSAA